MRLLLDTHVFLWLRADAPQMPQQFRHVIADPANIKLVSAIALTEVAVKRAVGKLDVPDNVGEGLEAIGLDHLAYNHRHAQTLDRLPLLHRDPFDRMLIAQAATEDAIFLTVDPQCQEYNVRLLHHP